MTPELHLETEVNLFIYRVVAWAKADTHSLRHNRSKQDETPAGGGSVYNHPLRPRVSSEGGPQSPSKFVFNTEQHLLHSARSSLTDTLSFAFLFIHCSVYKMLARLKKWKPFCIWIKSVCFQDGLDPIMSSDGCLTHLEHFMPCKRWPQQAEQAAISAPAGGLLIITNNIHFPSTNAN